MILPFFNFIGTFFGLFDYVFTYVTCSRCGEEGHQRNSRKCPLFSSYSPENFKDPNYKDINAVDHREATDLMQNFGKFSIDEPEKVITMDEEGSSVKKKKTTEKLNLDKSFKLTQSILFPPVTVGNFQLNMSLVPGPSQDPFSEVEGSGEDEDSGTISPDTIAAQEFMDELGKMWALELFEKQGVLNQSGEDTLAAWRERCSVITLDGSPSGEDIMKVKDPKERRKLHWEKMKKTLMMNSFQSHVKRNVLHLEENMEVQEDVRSESEDSEDDEIEEVQKVAHVPSKAEEEHWEKLKKSLQMLAKQHQQPEALSDSDDDRVLEVQEDAYSDCEEDDIEQAKFGDQIEEAMKELAFASWAKDNEANLNQAGKDRLEKWKSNK
jgi:hypothetical protein